MVSSSYSRLIAAASSILLTAQSINSFTISPLATNISSRQEQQSKSQLQVSSTPTNTATEYDIVKVDLTDGRDYPIYIGSDFSNDEASQLLQQHVVGKRALLITNDKIAPLYLEQYKALLEKDGNVQVDTVVLPDGEEHKTFDCMAMILDKALELGLDRKCTFVALGGGVIGDMVGFASAIYQRGVNFIQVSEMLYCFICVTLLLYCKSCNKLRRCMYFGHLQKMLT